jgi:orotidine-5'-phosphate decarboxylase
MATELITVLDVDSREEALAIVEACQGCDWFKIGFQLFTREGPPIVRGIQDMGRRVFLDLKFHDIPNTIAKGAKSVADMGVSLTTLHAVGGRKMIAGAREAVEGTDTRLLAVTILTSLSDEMLREEVGFPETAAQAVPRLAKMAIEAGAHGIVCSPLEIQVVRDAIGPEPLVVTPGVRPQWSSKDDQARIMTPADAARAGASMVVVGRPILKHENPAEAVRLIQEELAI